MDGMNNLKISNKVFHLEYFHENPSCSIRFCKKL